ncbi:MAG: hypothetical protein WB558_11790 [Terriglobales bacterium]
MLVLHWVAGGIYKLLFSHADEKLAKKREEKLAADIQRCVPFLFGEMGGRIVPNEGVEFPPPFDYAVITIDASGLRLRFTRGRDHLAVQIAPKVSPNSWHELSTVLSALEVPGIQRGSISELAQADRLLQLHMKEITDALAEDQYPHLRAQLQEIYGRDRVATKQLETEINRKLYG